MSTQIKKTFKEIGIIFTKEGECSGCLNDKCFNTVQSIFDNNEYHVHISTNESRSIFQIHCNISSSTFSSPDIEETFHEEEEAVKFICERFIGFECFNK